ncbi:MAG TPA: hypothetical protein VMF89_01550, partial [Polyangiales bacterium]|nr:hypothetical protein [Polyangiales bacterium]
LAAGGDLGGTQYERNARNQPASEGDERGRRCSRRAGPLQTQLAVSGMPGSMIARIIDVCEVSRGCEQQSQNRDNSQGATREGASRSHDQETLAQFVRGARLITASSMSAISLGGPVSALGTRAVWKPGG